MVIDHLGLPQPHVPPAPPQPFAALPSLLALAPQKNITVKITGACTLSHEPVPYKDIWDPLWRIFDAFGLDRCMWGTDWTRAVDVLSYQQGVEAFRITDRLSDSDRATLMGEALRRVYRWAPDRG
jgi:L-fuconolactonase